MCIFISLEYIPRVDLLCYSLKPNDEVEKLLATNVYVHVITTYFFIRIWYFLVICIHLFIGSYKAMTKFYGDFTYRLYG